MQQSQSQRERAVSAFQSNSRLQNQVFIYVLKYIYNNFK